MTIAKRGFGRAASLNEMIIAGKEFTDTVMELDINEVLATARYTKAIGRAAANIAGVELQKEGDSTSKRLVFAAYDNIHDLMRPALLTLGPEGAKDLLDSPITRATLQYLSDHASSYGLSVMARDYARDGDYLVADGNGLRLADGLSIPQKFESKRGGCPYAKQQNAPYFNAFTDRIVETYTEAYRRNMPYGMLEATRRLLQR